jgi:hypothetical protein
MGRYHFRPRIWTLERVVAEVRALHAIGELGSTVELARSGHRELVSAAQRYAGSWERAMRLAGMAYEPPRMWTKELVVREIRKLHRAGKSLAATQVSNALVLAAQRRFGSWPKARAYAVPGFADPYKSWTKRTLVDELAALHARGHSLSATELRLTGRGRLVNAAVRLFGSWDGARARVAGFTPTQRRWTKDVVLRAILARHRRKLSMSATAVQREDGPLMAAVLRYFESWPIARDAARVPYCDPRRTWPPERVLTALRRHSPNGKRPTIARVGQALYKVAIARFGSFPAACRAAGLEVDR